MNTPMSTGLPRSRIRSIALGLALLNLMPVFAGERVVKSLLETRHENVVIQKWDLSCGAAALTTLLNYQYGENFKEKDVAIGLMRREEYIRNPQMLQLREGFSLLDLKRYTDSLGYLGKGLGRLQENDLTAKAPFIAPITTRGYNHFVIVRGVLGDRVLLADPAWGNRTMRITDFMQSWIEYPSVGRVGFVVEPNGNTERTSVKNLLEPDDQHFVMLR